MSVDSYAPIRCSEPKAGGRAVLEGIVHAALSIAILAGSFLAGWGCSSFSGSIASGFASVEISGHTYDEIAAATIRVFEKKGYILEDMEDGLVFIKEGSERDQLAYGSNLSNGMPVMNRVKVHIIDLGEGTSRLECTAYIVQNKSGFHEHEIRLRRPRSGPYREMLQLVAASFTTRVENNP